MHTEKDTDEDPVLGGTQQRPRDSNTGRGRDRDGRGTERSEHRDLPAERNPAHRGSRERSLNTS